MNFTVTPTYNTYYLLLQMGLALSVKHGGRAAFKRPTQRSNNKHAADAL